MLTIYAAYLIRCWRQADGIERVEIVHIQTGERALTHSIAGALEWIERRRIGNELAPNRAQ